jgi:hypothetical protein
MPGKGLLSSLADKAQAAIATSPLASKFPAGSGQHDATAAGAHPPASSDAQYQTGYAAPAQEQSGTLGGRHHGLETIQHHLRTLQVQYSSVASLTSNSDLSHATINRSGVSSENRQLQLLITASKGVALDFDAAGRDAKAQSKELYLWGQTQGPDIKGKGELS